MMNIKVYVYDFDKQFQYTVFTCSISHNNGYSKSIRVIGQICIQDVRICSIPLNWMHYHSLLLNMDLYIFLLIECIIIHYY
jgi:hypothetical protein